MKHLFVTVTFVLFSAVVFSQKSNYQLSTHILDVSKGVPASAVMIKLERYDEQHKNWSFIDEKKTDSNGRVTDFLKTDIDHRGVYKLTFFVSEYFMRNGTDSFYPFVEVVFRINDQNHYHVPITLSAFGYSTYRGN